MAMVMKVAASKYCSIEVRITATVALFRDSVTSFQTGMTASSTSSCFMRSVLAPRILRGACGSVGVYRTLVASRSARCSISDFHHEYMI